MKLRIRPLTPDLSPALVDLFGGHGACNGWCQLSPRDSLPWLDRTWRLKRPDDQPAWSVSCLYVRKAYRRRGVTAALIDAAVKAAECAGAPAVEAYPLRRRSDPQRVRHRLLDHLSPRRLPHRCAPCPAPPHRAP
jgi:GNAT superfamily N-acetyltransferase